MKKYFTWLAESNRPKHIALVFIIGIFFGLDGAFVASATAEFKDWLWSGAKGGAFGWFKGNGFDWLDFAASMLGGLAGAAIHWIVV